jgi:hypothetical protein
VQPPPVVLVLVVPPSVVLPGVLVPQAAPRKTAKARRAVSETKCFMNTSR